MPDGQASAPGSSGEVDADARPATPKVRRRPRTLVIALAVVGAVLAAGAVVGLLVYDRATGIDRSTPTVVAGRFLVATIGNRDIRLTSLLVCNEFPAEEALRQAVAGIDESTSVSWHDLVSQQTPAGATVTAEVRLTATRNGQTYYGFEVWRLRLVNQDGWRVCSIDRS
jgi:hypothetical protein